MSETEHHTPHGTIVSRALWPALLAGARITVAEHSGNTMCDRCNKPGTCPRLRMAEKYLADPEMLAEEAEQAKPQGAL